MTPISALVVTVRERKTKKNEKKEQYLLSCVFKKATKKMTVALIESNSFAIVKMYLQTVTNSISMLFSIFFSAGHDDVSTIKATPN